MFQYPIFPFLRMKFYTFSGQGEAGGWAVPENP
jgi:hypothetical protein